MSELVHARIVIGELLMSIAIDHIMQPDHWVHAYSNLYRPLVEVGSTDFPGSCINDHIQAAFGNSSEVQSCN